MSDNRFKLMASAALVALAVPSTPIPVANAQASSSGSPDRCFNAVQGEIAWNYDDGKRWNPANINRLCAGQETNTQPAECFDRVMHSGVSWGGGRRWAWNNAINLCEGTANANATVSCFSDAIANGVAWPQAISQCEGSSPPIVNANGEAGECRMLSTPIAVSIINGVLEDLNPRIKIDHRDHSKGQHSLRPYITGQNVFETDALPEFGIDAVVKPLEDVDKIDRPRRIHFIQDLNSESMRLLPAENGVTLRTTFETEGNEIKGWFVATKVGNADRRAADANILGGSGPLPFVDLHFNLNYDASRTLDPFNMAYLGIDVDMDVDGNGFLEIFENLIGRKLRSVLISGIEAAWPGLQHSINQAAATLLMDELDIPDIGGATITRLRSEGNMTELCYR